VARYRLEVLGREHALRDEAGLSGVVGVISIAVSLIVVLLLSLIGSGALSSKSGGGSSVFSNSSAEKQLQLCVEGRPSSYGDPPSPAVQAECTRELAAQIGGAPVATVPTTSSPSGEFSGSYPGGFSGSNPGASPTYPGG